MHSSPELTLASLHFVHFIIDIVVIVAKAIVAAKSGEA
jgi:hypothetical protein